MTQLPPQDSSDYPYIKGASASIDGAYGSRPPTPSSPAFNVGRPFPGPDAGYPSGPPPLQGIQQPPPGPGSHPWSVPAPVPYIPYGPVMLVPAPGIPWNDPVLTAERKRATNRRVAVWGGIVGLVTAIVQTIVTAALFLGADHLGDGDAGLIFLALLIIVFGPMIVGVGWIASFIVALIACTQAHSQTDRIQPDGWTEAKMPTSAQLAASIVLGIPTVVMYVALYRYASVEIDMLPDTAFVAVIIICALVQVLIAVAYAVLLRKNAALDVAVGTAYASEGEAQ